MTLPTQNSACKCSSNNCSNCKCGCNPSCCSNKTIDKSAIPSYPQIRECPFVKAYPDWQKCPVMSKMFEVTHGIKDESAEETTQEPRDSSECSQMSMSECHCSKLNHIVTLQMDTELATDQSEENTL